jgi:hypothetical protein
MFPFIVATPVAEDDQVTGAVKFRVLPSLNVPVAVNDWVAPSGIVEFAGVTAIVFNVTALTPSLTLMGSLIEMLIVVGGAGGAAVVGTVVLSARDCVKLDPEAALVRLLNAALSVNVIVPLGVPLAGAA